MLFAASSSVQGSGGNGRGLWREFLTEPEGLKVEAMKFEMLQLKIWRADHLRVHVK